MAEEKKKPNFGKKKDLEVDIFVDITNPDEPLVLNQEEESKLPTPLPETICKISSTWARNSFLLDNLISMNQYSEKSINGKVQRVFDANALVLSRIRCLLKTIDLPDLKLDFVDSLDAKGVKILSDTTMLSIGEIDSSIINSLYNKAMDKIYPAEGLALKKLLAGRS